MRQATQPAKPDISIYDFEGLTADIFTALANWLKALFVALLTPRSQSFQDG